MNLTRPFCYTISPHQKQDLNHARATSILRSSIEGPRGARCLSPNQAIQEGSTCAIIGEATRRFSLDLLSKTTHNENFVRCPFITMNSRSNLHLLLELAQDTAVGIQSRKQKKSTLRNQIPRLDIDRCKQW